MPQYFKLNTGHFPLFTNDIQLPRYDRSRLKTGILHMGAERLFRSHAAVFMDDVLNGTPDDTWGICLAGIYEQDRKAIEALQSQEGLYTVMVTPPGGTLTARIIGSVKECILLQDVPDSIILKIASPDTAIISIDLPLDTDESITVFRLLAEGLRKRRDERLPGLTILALEDTGRNGEKTRSKLLSFVKDIDPGLVPWIETEVSFPASVVDRIVPHTTLKDKENLKAIFAVDDGSPVMTEPFKQWILEDQFKAGRPAWENAGVMFTRDTRPYERMKLGLVNGGHILLAMLGTLEDCLTVDDALAVPLIGQMLSRYMDKEVLPLLGSVAGINPVEYRDTVVRRFANSSLRDPISRICIDSHGNMLSAIVPVIRESLANGGPIKVASLVVAAWCRYIELTGQTEFGTDSIEFLKTREGFADLVKQERFVSTLHELMDALRKFGSEVTMRYLDQFVPGE